MKDYIFNNTIFVTYTNLGYVKYSINLWKSIKKAGIPWKLLIMATDEESIAELAKHEIPAILYTENEENIKKDFIAYTDKSFNSITFVKLDILSFILETMQDKITHLVYMDSDIVVTQDFTSILDWYRSHDIVFQCDEDNYYICCGKCSNFCTGFMMMKNNKTVYQILEYKNPEQYLHDQHYMNIKLRGCKIDHNTFARNIFPNGYLRGYVNNPYCLFHYNYLIGAKKEEAMKEDGM